MKVREYDFESDRVRGIIPEKWRPYLMVPKKYDDEHDVLGIYIGKIKGVHSVIIAGDGDIGCLVQTNRGEEPFLFQLQNPPLLIRYKDSHSGRASLRMEIDARRQVHSNAWNHYHNGFKLGEVERRTFESIFVKEFEKNDKMKRRV